MVDTLLFIFVGVLAVSMAVIGGFVSATASWQKWAFALMGILSFLLIVWQGVRDSRRKGKAGSARTEDQIKQLVSLLWQHLQTTLKDCETTCRNLARLENGCG